MGVTDTREPWLRGILSEFDPVTGHLLRASQQIREDVRKAVESLQTDEVHARPNGVTSCAFHVRHLAGSTRRLCAYLQGRGLTAEELAGLAAEGDGGESTEALLMDVDRAFDRYETLVRELKPADFAALRYVGRARLAVTAIGLAIHIAEHGQRHTGQAISAAKLARAIRNE